MKSFQFKIYYLIAMIITLVACKNNSTSLTNTPKLMDKTLSIFENMVKVELYDPSAYGISLELKKVSGDDIPPTINIAQAFSNEVNTESFVAVCIIPGGVENESYFDFNNLLGGVLYKVESDTMQAAFYTIQNGKEVVDSSLMGKTALLDVSSLYDVTHAKFPEAKKMILLVQPEKVKAYEGQLFQYDKEVARYK